MTVPNFLKKNGKKILLILGIILLVTIGINIGISQWIKAKLPAIIEERNDTGYDFAFEDIGFSIHNSSISVEGISIQPKPNFPKKLPIDFTAKVEEIKVVGVNFFKLMTEKDLSAYSIEINKPEITYRRPEIRDTTKSDSKLGNSIHVSNFEINEGKFTMYDSDKTTLISHLENINLDLGGVNLSERTIEKNIPFTYSSFELKSDSIFFQLNPLQKLQVGNLKANNNLFQMKRFKIETAENSSANNQKEKFRLSPEVIAPNVSFSGLDWGFTNSDEFFFKASRLTFDSIDVRILKQEKISQNTVSNPSQNLIPFHLDIQKVVIGNSRFRIQNQLDASNINIQIDKILNSPKKNLVVENIILDHPIVTTFSSKNKSKEKKNSSPVSFEDIIDVKNLHIKKAEYKLNQLSGNKNLLKVLGIDFQMNGIKITPLTIKEKIPLTYQNLKLSANSVDYNPSTIYHLTTKDVVFDNGNFMLNSFRMQPKISRSQFVRQLKKEKDLYTISAKSVRINQFEFGFIGDDLSFDVPSMELQSVHANIYRSKIPTDDTTKKPLYNHLLRSIPFYLQVKKLNLVDSVIEYEEESETSTGAGKLSFTKFNAKVADINSGFKRTSLPDVKINVKTNFMNDSKLVADWTLNPLDRTDKFTIKGSIFNFDAKRMTPFIKPYLHASADGNMQEVRFNFTGNDVNAHGDFGIKYKDLKVTLYNQKGKERKVLSAIGNLAVKSDTKDKYVEEKIKSVERKQDRSFFNFFWLCVQQGLKQTLLII